MSQVEAVIFDWAGTMVDFGSLAPVRAITELFRREGIDLSDADARRDMGIFKKDHIRKILQIPEIEEQWQKLKGKRPAETDVSDLFLKFVPLQFDVLASHSKLIEGAAQVCEDLKGRGMKIGSTTGYTRPMLDLLLRSAASQGYCPDLALCPDEVGGGRPLPWMCWRTALDFKLSSAAAAVKIGDTPSDIQEARNAGMWAVGVAGTGNEIGMSAQEFAALPHDESIRRFERACEVLRMAGAHYVVETVAGIHPILDEIAERLEAGERP
jgi:phosphonoacetaldehyde hydrolase